MSLIQNLIKKGQIEFGERQYLGVDIGTSSIKVVEVSKGLKGPKLINYGTLETKGHLDRVNNAIQTSSLEMEDSETASMLKTLLDQVQPETESVIASLPGFSTFTSLIELPDMPDEEVSQAVSYQAQSIVPLPINKVTLDWNLISKYKDGDGHKKQQVLIVAVANRVIQKYQQIFKTVGLDLKALEVEGISLARVLTAKDPTLSIIIDIGSRATSILVAQDGLLRHSAQANYAGTSFTKAIARGLEINSERAEALKVQRGLKGVGGEYEVSTLMTPYINSVIDDAIRIKNNYEANYGGAIERVLLSGGSANLVGIEEYVSNRMGLPAVKGEPFASQVEYPKEIAPATAQLGPVLAVALGLGIRQFTEKRK